MTTLDMVEEEVLITCDVCDEQHESDGCDVTVLEIVAVKFASREEAYGRLLAELELCERATLDSDVAMFHARRAAELRVTRDRHDAGENVDRELYRYLSVTSVSHEIVTHVEHMNECQMCCEDYLPHQQIANKFGNVWNRIPGTIALLDWPYSDQVCVSCSNNATDCLGCGDMVSSEEAHWVEYNDGYVCDYCERYELHTCDYCDEEYVGDSHDVSECRDEHESEQINSYSYRPAPIFHTGMSEETSSSTPFMGFELEMEIDGYVNEAAEYAVSRIGDRAYLKHDASLSDGFELVTHPHTLLGYRESFPFDMLQVLVDDHKAKSWRTSTCGLHVHISRAAFQGLTHQAAFTHLIQDNPAQMSRLAGRTNSQWAKFGGETDGMGKPVTIAKKVRNGGTWDRYQAVNTLNRSTIEVRIFRGSMMTRRVMMALELVDAAFHYTRNKGAKALTSGQLTWPEFAKWLRNRKEYENLNYYIRLYKLDDQH